MLVRKNQRSRRAMFGGIVALLLTISAGGGAVSAQEPYSDGKAALLIDADITKLAALNAAVAVPTYLPAGYGFKKLWIQEPDAHIVAFSILYENAAGKSFTIQSNNEALGDMAVKREVKGTNTLFKDSAQEVTTFHAGHDKNDARTVASEWFCSIPKYQPKKSIAQCFQFLTEGGSLSPAEAMKVMSSLRYLKR